MHRHNDQTQGQMPSLNQDCGIVFTGGDEKGTGVLRDGAFRQAGGKLRVYFVA